jgi:hypothetical protein
MSTDKFFEITIENGKVQAEGQGFQGEGCDVIAQLLASLGKDADVRRKPDFYRKSPVGTARRQTE